MTGDLIPALTGVLFILLGGAAVWMVAFYLFNVRLDLVIIWATAFIYISLFVLLVKEIRK